MTKSTMKNTSKPRLDEGYTLPRTAEPAIEQLGDAALFRLPDLNHDGHKDELGIFPQGLIAEANNGQRFKSPPTVSYDPDGEGGKDGMLLYIEGADLPEHIRDDVLAIATKLAAQGEWKQADAESLQRIHKFASERHETEAPRNGRPR